MSNPENPNLCDAIVPETVEIIGERSLQADGSLAEADVVFEDNCANKWYITVTTGDQHVINTLRDFEEVTPGDFADHPERLEPPVFVWNGTLTGETLPKILGQQSMSLLRDYVVPFDDESS